MGGPNLIMTGVLIKRELRTKKQKRKTVSHRERMAIYKLRKEVSGHHVLEL